MSGGGLLLDRVNWTEVLAAPRYAGGHDEIMTAMFSGYGEVLAHYNEGDYQGEVATAWLFPDGMVGIVTDYYGSCSGCDSYECASDDGVRKLVTGTVGAMRMFDSEPDAVAFCEWLQDNPEYAEHFSHRAAAGLRRDGSWVRDDKRSES